MGTRSMRTEIFVTGMMISGLRSVLFVGPKGQTPTPEKEGNTMHLIDTSVAVLRKLTELAIALLSLAVVMQVVFGSAVPFLNVDVIANLTAVIASLGSSGLVGLIAVGVLYAVLTKKA